MNQESSSRRDFCLNTLAAGIAGSICGSGILRPGLSLAEKNSNIPLPKVAAVFTELRFRSHAFNILENFLSPYLFNGQLIQPGVQVVSFYADQFPEGDLAREVAQKFDIPIFPSIDQSLCLGGKNLAVDAVLLIGEHGNYPHNELGQHLYPRKQFFDQIMAVMKRSGRGVPLFNDKHLSYRWDWSKQMYDEARAMKIPFIAGSSVPLAERVPAVEIPSGTEIEEAVAIHGGGFESYDFHGLEVLQSVVESRKGGETGVQRVEYLKGEELFRAADQGRWSKSLAESALKAELGAAPTSWGQIKPNEPETEPTGILITYKDGLRGVVLRLGQSSVRWNFACRMKGGEVRAHRYYVGPWGNRCLFKALSHSIQQCFIHQEEPYPLERTLLVSGILDRAVHSAAEKKPLATPELHISYEAKDFKGMREMGESWKVITKNTSEPRWLDTLDAEFLRQAKQSR